MRIRIDQKLKRLALLSLLLLLSMVIFGLAITVSLRPAPPSQGSRDLFSLDKPVETATLTPTPPATATGIPDTAIPTSSSTTTGIPVTATLTSTPTSATTAAPYTASPTRTASDTPTSAGTATPSATLAMAQATSTPTTTTVPGTATRTPAATATSTIGFPGGTATATPTLTAMSRAATPTSTGTPNAGLPTVKNGDFELGGNNGWAESSTNGHALIVNSGFSTLLPRSGQYLAWPGGDNNETSDISQTLAIPASGPVYLQWYYQLESSEPNCTWDTFELRVNSTTVGQKGLCSSNVTSDWTRESVDMSSYRGQTVTVHFRVNNDASTVSNYFVDDVSFQSSP